MEEQLRPTAIDLVCVCVCGNFLERKKERERGERERDWVRQRESGMRTKLFKRRFKSFEGKI